MAALCKIVLDPKWLSNLHFYVRFRLALLFSDHKLHTFLFVFITYHCLLYDVHVTSSIFMSPWFPDSPVLNFFFSFTFRHTGEFENFNSMMTKYAPKRMAFEYVLVQSKISSDFLGIIHHLSCIVSRHISYCGNMSGWSFTDFSSFLKIFVVILEHFVFSQVPIFYYENPTSSHWPQFSPIPKAQAEQRGRPCGA